MANNLYRFIRVWNCAAKPAGAQLWQRPMNLDGKNSLWRWRRIDVITLSVVVCFIVAGSIGQEMHGQKRVVGDNFQPVIASLMPVLVQDTLPATAYAMIGDQITFSAGFQNFSGAVFQWQKISNGTVWDIPGATNMTLTLTNLQLADAAAYWLEAVNASDHALIAHSSARPLTVDRLPPAVNNVITVVAAQTGLGGATTFIPTWVVTTNNNLIAGQLPSNCSGDFSLESPGRSVGCLTLSNNGALTVIKIGLNRTSSTNYVTCGNGNWAGSSDIKLAFLMQISSAGKATIGGVLHFCGRFVINQAARFGYLQLMGWFLQ